MSFLEIFFVQRPIWCNNDELFLRHSDEKLHPRAVAGLFENYLMREFEQSRPNQVWVSDITYVKVENEYFYICVILDLFSRLAISYDISDVMDTTLTMKTFGEAFKKRGKPKSLMFHSDHGVQYTSFAFRCKVAFLCKEMVKNQKY